jgi:nickel transport system ATP-binding protein
MILEAEGIKVSFKKENQKSLFGRERQQVLKGTSIGLKEGECLGIIGESGSGKSTLGKVLTGLLKPDSGKVTLNGVELYKRHSRLEKKRLSQGISIVFQDYVSSTNPRFLVKDIIGESLRTKERKTGIRFNRDEAVKKLLEQVGLDQSYMNRYPHQLSGGQLQRVCIARAIAVEPKVILLDEAVSSLDASIQTQIMDLLIELQRKYKFSYIFITHDLPTVTYMCDRVVFFYEGQIVEEVEDMRELPYITNEYARKLIHSVMTLDLGIDEEGVI